MGYLRPQTSQCFGASGIRPQATIYDTAWGRSVVYFGHWEQLARVFLRSHGDILGVEGMSSSLGLLLDRALCKFGATILLSRLRRIMLTSRMPSKLLPRSNSSNRNEHQLETPKPFKNAYRTLIATFEAALRVTRMEPKEPLGLRLQGSNYVPSCPGASEHANLKEFLLQLFGV